MTKRLGLVRKGIMAVLLLATGIAVRTSPCYAANEVITVHAFSGDGPANLVSNAVPFPPNALFDPRNIRILDGSTEIPLAAKVLAYWPQDNSIRSVLIQFEASFTTTTKTYTLNLSALRSTSDRTLLPVTWDLPTRIFTMSAEYLSHSLFAWEQVPLGRTGFPDWDSKQLNRYASIDIPISPANTCANSDQYYDSISSHYQLYARTGDLRYLVNGRRWASHHRRDQIWLDGSTIGHPKCSAPNNARYTYPQGLILDYFMFGDEEAKRVSGLVVDYFYIPYADRRFYIAPNTRGFWTEREAAFALRGILAHYEATNDSAYLNEARRKITLLHRMQVENGRRAWVHNLYDHDPEERCSPPDWGSSPWMSGLLLEAIIQYHKLTNDPIAVESITMALDDLMAHYLATGNYAGKSFVYLGCPAYVNGNPDLDNMIAHAFAYGYRLTGNADYLRVGTDIFNTSVEEGYAGEHKQYNQLFRSSGHFVAYVLPDTTPPTVSINQAAEQDDPAVESPINFTVAFSEPVSGFANGDVLLSGTAGANTAVVTATGLTYHVAVSGMTRTGTVVVTIPAGVVSDVAGNFNVASTSFDNTVNYQSLIPTLSSINPASVTAGGGFVTLVINGTNFRSGAVVRWNGASRDTTVLSASRLIAIIPASDAAVAGTAQITVDNSNGIVSPALTFTITSSGPIQPVPSVGDGGVLNNAGYNLASLALAPGMIAEVFGTNLTDGSSCFPPSCNPAFGSDGRLDTTMSGARVTVNGTAVPIYYASPGQLGIQIPTELTGAEATIQVSVDGQNSPPQTVSVEPVSPGIFAFTGDGRGPGAITHADGSAVSAQNPARPGELVILYATGLGHVSPAVPTGARPTEVSRTVEAATVIIDGTSVIPDFVGLAGCCVGLNQVNVRIPESTRSANDIPLVLTIGGKQSNQVTTAVSQ